MNFFSRTLVAAALAAIAAPAMITTANAQAMAGRQLEDRPQVSVSYYKTAPGKQDEWLEAYLKWHRPIMDWQIKEGLTLSTTIYANAGHALAPQWDFMIINVAPAPKDAKKARLTRGEVIAELYPDLEAYYEGEKRRWELTEAHWDQRLMEVDITAERPGVYYPILPKKGK